MRVGTWMHGRVVLWGRDCSFIDVDDASVDYQLCYGGHDGEEQNEDERNAQRNDDGLGNQELATLVPRHHGRWGCCWRSID